MLTKNVTESDMDVGLFLFSITDVYGNMLITSSLPLLKTRISSGREELRIAL